MKNCFAEYIWFFVLMGAGIPSTFCCDFFHPGACPNDPSPALSIDPPLSWSSLFPIAVSKSFLNYFSIAANTSLAESELVVEQL